MRAFKFIPAIAILFLSSLLSAQEGSPTTVSLPSNEYYGQKISEDGAVKPAEFLKRIENKDSIDVKLEAKIITVCKKKGCWMDVDLENGTSMKVKFKDYEFFVPKNADGRIVIMEGRAKLETTDVATLRHYAEDAGKSADEVSAITKPEEAYSFEAFGVIIK